MGRSACQRSASEPSRWIVRICRVAPGSYVLMCYSAGLYCHVPVTLVDHDVDLAVEPTPGPTIEGTIKMEGGGAFPKPPVVQLFDKAVAAKEDGTFGWTNLVPKKYYSRLRPTRMVAM